MPSIITTPARVRNNTRAMTPDDVSAYIDLMHACDSTESVLVDDAVNLPSYEKAYVRAERVRTYARRYNLVPVDRKITVIALENDDSTWSASVALIDA
jgi:hypothetical protein